MARVYVDERSDEQIELETMRDWFLREVEEDRMSRFGRDDILMPDLYNVPSLDEFLFLYRIFRWISMTIGCYPGDDV